MRNTEDIVKAPLEAEQDFAKFLKRVRKEENVYLEQLAEGLMTVSQLARIEKGQRPIPKNMRDRLLGRLGVANDLYENLLNIEDYEAWGRQRDILSAVERRDTQRAWKLILAYENQTLTNDKVTQQFCLMMEAEVLKQQDVDQCEIAACYERAAKYTVPDIGRLCLKQKLLSIQEINMILEYEYYHKGEDFAQKCRELMTFVENTAYDDLSKVKVYPKIVYYYLKEVLAEQHEQTAEKLREELCICNQAIEMLRDTGRAFFLLELLEQKIKILDYVRRALEADNEPCLEYQESIELISLLKKLSAEYDVSMYMQDCVYLYQQRWVFYIGDVLRMRRKMYGFTQKELCQGVCSVRTLRRAEKKEANMQHEYLDVLLRKLGLSKEFQRARLVTNDREVLRLKKEMLVARNNRDFIRCRELLSQIRKRISLEIPENRQYIIELEATLDWLENKITKKEYVEREEKALKCTLKVKEFVNAKEIYLTEMEVSCIRNMLFGQDGIKKTKHIDFWLRFFALYEKENLLSDCIVMYEYVMVYIANELGNAGEYQEAIKLDRKLLKADFTHRRIWMIGNILYDILWSEMKQEKSVNKEKMTEILVQCRLLSHFCKQKFYEDFYDDKLHQS